MIPNTFAYIVLLSLPVLSLLFFKQFATLKATVLTIIVAYLLLPVKAEIDLPLIPPLTKETISALSVLIGVIFIKREKIFLIPKTGIEKWLIIIVIFTPFITLINNSEVINGIRGLTIHDAISSSINQYLLLLPLIIGMQIVNTYEDQLQLFKFIVIACILYSLPILWEIRMSPQLHSSVYGYFPHSFVQQKRFEGFRPVVFMGHGLLVSMFVAVSLGAAAIMRKQKEMLFGLDYLLFIAYFIILLYLCKTIGSFVLGIMLFSAITFFSTKTVNLLSRIFIFTILLYPLLLILDLFPHEYLVNYVGEYFPERAESLAFRFYHESLLLEHSLSKLFFGWGGWGRWRLEESVSDGFWIITFAEHGLVGFSAFFGLLCVGVMKVTRKQKILADNKEKDLLLGHTFLVVIIMIDQIPNASLYSISMLIIGALLGRYNNIMKEHNLHQSKDRNAVFKD